MKYQNYLKSKHWLSLRDKWINHDFNAKCEICGARAWTLYKRKTEKKGKVFNPGDLKKLTILSIHHKHYNTLYHEKRSDVMILCKRCHMLAHDIDKAYHKSHDGFKVPYAWLLSLGWAYEKRKKEGP